MRRLGGKVADVAVVLVLAGAFLWQGWPGAVIAAVMLIVAGVGTAANALRDPRYRRIG